MNDTKIKFEKPVFFAQNSGEGSFSAGCMPMMGGAGSNNVGCKSGCYACERNR